MRPAALLLLVLTLCLGTAHADVVHDMLAERATTVTGEPAPQWGRQPVVLWSFDAPDFGGDINTVCDLDDIDGDGFPEVIASIYDAGMSGDNLYCFSGASSGLPTVIWSLRTSTGVSGGGGYGDKCLAATYDLNGDGYQEVLHGTAWGGRSALCFSGFDGAQLWVYDTYNDPQSGWVYAMERLPDVTGDGLPEALAASGADNSTVYCIDGASAVTATVVWKYSAPDGFTSVVPIGDVNGDGYDDALAGCGTNFAHNRAYCFSGASTGTATVLWSLQSTSVVYAVAATSDINGDGVQEALAGSWSDTVYCVSGASSGAPTILWRAGIGDAVMRLVPITDLDGDGYDEVLVGSWDNAVICLRGVDGAVLWYTPVGTLNGGDVWSLDATGDLDGDGLADVVAGSFDQNVYLCSGADGHILEQFSTGKRLYTVRSVPDVDGDGLDDLLAGTQGLSGTRGTLYCLSGVSMVPIELASFGAHPADEGIAVVWETASELDNLGFHVWRAGHVSESWGRRLTATPVPGAGTCSSPRFYEYVDSDVVGGTTYYYRLEQLDLGGTSTCYGPVVARFPGRATLWLSEPTPQPAGNRVAVTYSLPAAGDYAMRILNARGQVIRSIRGRAPAAGTYTASVGCRDLSPGAYVLALTCEEGTVSERLIVSAD